MKPGISYPNDIGDQFILHLFGSQPAVLRYESCKDAMHEGPSSLLDEMMASFVMLKSYWR